MIPFLKARFSLRIAQVRLTKADLKGVADAVAGSAELASSPGPGPGSDCGSMSMSMGTWSSCSRSRSQQINALGPAVRRQCFVLYQYARMCKLVDTFDERLRTGELKSLTQSLFVYPTVATLWHTFDCTNS